MYLFIALEIFIHMSEELIGGFPSWATRHFGTTTLEWYILSHIILFPFVMFIVYKAEQIKKYSIWAFIAIAIQTVIFTNGIFHLTTTIIFKEYSPGLISSCFITFPFSYYFYKKIFQSKMIPKKDILKAIMLGVIASLLIIASLYLNF